MLRLIFSLFATCGLFLIIGSSSYADFRFSDGSKIEVQWYEKNGEILNEHVCFNYKDDKRKLKQCRKKAKDYFKEECKFFTDKVKHSKKKYRDMYKPDQAKFCNASEVYKP